MIGSALSDASSWLAALAPWAESDDVAIISGENEVSGAEFVDLARRAARWLDEIGAGDHCPIPSLVEASATTYALTVAACATGRPIAALAPRHTARELIACSERLNSSVVISEPAYAEIAQQVCDALGRRLVIVPADMPRRGRDFDWDVAPESIAIVLHTSGTTGIPKSVALRQDRLIRRCRINAAALRVGPGSRLATASPYYHIAGFGMAGVALAAGSSLVTLERFTPDVWSSLQTKHITHATLVPTMIDTLLSLGELSLGELQVMQYGAAPMPPDLLRRAMDALPGVGFVTLYGQTEGTPISGLTIEDHARFVDERPEVLASVGRAVTGSELMIHDPDGDGIGEIWSRAPHLFNPSDDGWLRTGDLGRLDHEGFLYLVGRKGDMIIRGGENIYPAEVESIIERHANVRECAVVGLPDPHWGEIVATFVVMHDPAAPIDITELRALCREQLAGFKVPTRWEFIDHLPRNPTGKVLRRALIDRLGSVER